MCTLPFVIAFVFVEKKVLFKDIDVRRRKTAKIFASFLSGKKRAENFIRAIALLIWRSLILQQMLFRSGLLQRQADVARRTNRLLQRQAARGAVVWRCPISSILRPYWSNVKPLWRLQSCSLTLLYPSRHLLRRPIWLAILEQRQTATGTRQLFSFITCVCIATSGR